METKTAQKKKSTFSEIIATFCSQTYIIRFWFSSGAEIYCERNIYQLFYQLRKLRWQTRLLTPAAVRWDERSLSDNMTTLQLVLRTRFTENVLSKFIWHLQSSLMYFMKVLSVLTSVSVVLHGFFFSCDSLKCNYSLFAGCSIKKKKKVSGGVFSLLWV